MSAEHALAIVKDVIKAGGVDAARARARGMVDEAIADLGALPPSRFREALREIAVLSVERVS